MNVRSLAILLAIFAALLGWAAPASAQTTTTTSPVLVYRLSFKASSDSINFHNYQGGYYVSDVTGGVGTMILTKVLGGTRKYYTLTNYGAIFYGLKGKERKAIMTGSKTNTSTVISNITFQAMGNATKSSDYQFANGEFQGVFATKLEGVALFADSQEDLPFAGGAGADIGTAATVSVTFTLQDGLTELSRKSNITRTAMITQLKNQLADQDYSNGDTTTLVTTP
jgi:hypothetical protein